MRSELRAVGRQFGIAGAFVRARPLAGGHIHESYVATYRQNGRRARYVHQRLNRKVFADPTRLLENVARVSAHLHAQLAREGVSDRARRALTLLPALGGQPWWVDDSGAFWRTYPYIEHSRSYGVVPSPMLAERAAEAFAQFVRRLTDLPGGPLHETIAGFHDTAARLRRLRTVVGEDALGRAREVQRDLEFVFARASLAHVLAELSAGGALTTRVVHNDTKIENVLFDTRTREALCVVDLDTVMSGLVLHDFGDLVRSSLSPVAEDETELERIVVRLPVFEALVRGYLHAAGSLLSEQEMQLLPLAGRIVALEAGMRFLTDYLLGDVYFRTGRPRHNLERARNQFELVRRMEGCEAQMTALVEQARGRR